jgi:hypothetical protein
LLAELVTVTLPLLIDTGLLTVTGTVEFVTLTGTVPETDTVPVTFPVTGNGTLVTFTFCDGLGSGDGGPPCAATPAESNPATDAEIKATDTERLLMTSPCEVPKAAEVRRAHCNPPVKQRQDC